jgi:hypothetical protein
MAPPLKELMELQKQIDESARAIVKSVRTLVDHRSEYRPVRAADYPDRDAAFYDGTDKELAAEGVRPLGDFEDAAFSRRHPDKDAFVRLGLSDDGTIGAIWFKLGAASSVAFQSWLEDGRELVTVRAGTETAVPNRPEVATERVGLETAVRDVVRRHRSRVGAAGALPRLLRGLEDLLAGYADDEAASASFREQQGLALFEPMMRKKLGDRYDEEGEPLVQAIHAHPEWWTGETPKPPQSPAGPVRLMFLASRDDNGRSHVTTAGLMTHGLPELQMKAVAGHHCRAARFLMGVVARKHGRDVPERPLPVGLELALTHADVALPNEFVALGRYPEVAVERADPARVRLVLEAFGGNPGLFSMLGGSDPELLHLLPPADYQGAKDEWLRETCRRLGQDAPAPLSPDALEAQMQAASRKAKETLGGFRARFRSGLPGDHTLLIKLGLTTTRGGREYVWIKVGEWTPDGVLVGTLETEPRDVPGLKQGQEMRVPERDVFDRAIFSKEQGMVEVALTDIVAQEFGVDL